MLAKQGSQMFCPGKKGESSWDKQFNHAFRKLSGRAVSSVGQPIEAFLSSNSKLTMYYFAVKD
ncbi:MAG: hypothetical protein KTR26_06305 [Flammeovirgaceae bacterium]|nr:hypothetical protein [Flammeovirgaceae bacterium]